MRKIYDSIVLGVGGFGSGTLDALARRGKRVLGIERFDVAHDRGSSHGETRIIRKAYFEHPDYVPLLFEAYRMWEELDANTPEILWNLCGLMLAGPPDGEAVAGARASALQHGLDIQNVARAEAMRRFRGFRFPDGFDVVFESQAGYLHVERCVRALVDRALAHGATIKTNETVIDWKSDGRHVRVRTDQDSYEAAALVITAGPWAAQVLANLHLPLWVVRKPVFWCRVTTGDYNVSAGAPAWFFEMPEGQFYGFPSLDGQTLKLAQHTGGATVADPTYVDRTLHAADFEPARVFLEQVVPGVVPRPVRHSVCMYTLTPDRHFIIDVHPEYANVAIGAGFSGHGYKFTTVLGEALADLATKGRTALPVKFLSLSRAALRV